MLPNYDAVSSEAVHRALPRTLRLKLRPADNEGRTMKYTAIILGVGLLASCSGGDFDGELRPADEVTAETQEATGKGPITGEIGESYEMADGQILTVTSIELHPDATNDGPFDRTHVVNVRVENRTEETLFAAEGAIYCEGSDDNGPWFGDSTYDQYGDLPTGAFIEGDLILGIRSDEPDCTNPVVQFEADNFITFEGEDRTIIQYPIGVP
jgi:hypothetical protein